MEVHGNYAMKGIQMIIQTMRPVRCSKCVGVSQASEMFKGVGVSQAS